MAGQGRPKRTEWPKCRVMGCENTTRKGGKGMCHTHYVAARRGRIDMETGEALRPAQRISSYGPGARCLVPDCQRRPKGRGLCTLHYQQWKSGQDLGVEIPDRGIEKSANYPEAAVCKVQGCDKRPVNRWMCQRHAQQRQAGIIDENGHQLRDPKWRPGRGWRSYCRGYRKVMSKGHPRADRDGYILEHRLVMEQYLGRYLEPTEVVHHVNGVRDDNRIENLQLRENRRAHGHGHEPIDSIEQALSFLERTANPGMTGAESIKNRLLSLTQKL